jgi:hypothetical protein
MVGWVAALLIPDAAARRPAAGDAAGLPRPRGTGPSVRGDAPVGPPS